MKIRDSHGKILDASFSVTKKGKLELVLESRGGSGKQAKNRDYKAGLRELLERLRSSGAVIDQITLASRGNEATPISVEDFPAPIALRDVESLEFLISRISQGQAKTGRASWAKGSGNSTKRIRLTISGPLEKRDPKTIEKLLGGIRANTAGHPSPADEQQIPSDDLVREALVRNARRYQGRFRRSLLRRYEGRCVISGTAIEEVLEAAHIDPHSEAGDNDVANGLLLRADLHVLFDEGLLRIDPHTLRAFVADSIRNSEYGTFHDRKLSLPPGTKPDTARLVRRWRAPRLP